MSWYHSGSQHTGSQNSYAHDRKPYPPSAAHEQHTSQDVYPTISYQPAYKRDNGWGDRRARYRSNVAPQQSYPMRQSWNGTRTAPNDYPPTLNYDGWAPLLPSSYPMKPEIGAAERPLTADPRRAQPHKAPYSGEVLASHPLPSRPIPADAGAINAVEPLTMVSQKDRKLGFLLRSMEEAIGTKFVGKEARWERNDTKRLEELIEEYKKINTESSMVRIRTMHTALDYFLVLLDCRQGQRIDPTLESTIPVLRIGVRDIMFDTCEDSERDARKEAYRALLRLSSTDLLSARNNCSVLVQLLQNNGENGELELVQEMLARHIKLCISTGSLEFSLQDCLQMVLNDFAGLRAHVLGFLCSAWGQCAIDSIIGDCTRESTFARHLALLLPCAVEEEYAKIDETLDLLHNIWPLPGESLSDDDKAATRDAGATVLWNVCRVLMQRSNTFVFTSRDGSVESFLMSASIERLVDLAPASTTSIIKDGHEVFKNSIEVLNEIISTSQQDDTIQRSEAEQFVNELAASTRYLFCYLPPAGSDTESNQVLQNFTPVQRVVFFRSVANLAARVASAARQSPPRLNYDGENVVKEVAMVTIRALLTHLPTEALIDRGDSASGGTSSSREAREAYLILAGEALLTAIDQCEIYLSSVRRVQNLIFNNNRAWDRVQALNKLVRDVCQKHEAHKEVLESAAVVLSLSQEYSKRWRSHYDCTPPTWLISPPPFPRWGPPVIETEAAVVSVKREENESRPKRKGSEEGSDKGRRVRGRGMAMADNDDADQSWETIHPPEPRTPSDLGLGISIRGSSQAERRSPKTCRDTCRPGDGATRAFDQQSPTYEDRVSGRMQSDRMPTSSRSSYRDRDMAPKMRWDHGDDSRSRRSDDWDRSRYRLEPYHGHSSQRRW